LHVGVKLGEKDGRVDGLDEEGLIEELCNGF
jgi:hypothetical protein